VKRRTLIAAVSAVGVALAIAPAVASASAAASTRPATAATFGPLTEYFGGSNWTGYVDLAHRGVKFRYVAAKFRVPTVRCTSANSKSSFWVGLDGAGTPTVEQVGLSTDCHSGHPTYQSWYEMFPQGVQYMFSVHPGDSLSMWVSQPSNGGIYELSVTDTTGGHTASFVVSRTCPARVTCDSSTAEAILEANNGTDLSKFTTVTFTNSTVIPRSGPSGAFQRTSLWNVNKSLMTGANGQPLATVSATSHNGTVFSVAYREAR
jgi:Peptidase A4 family